MNLRSVQKNWDTLAARDPFWAILTAPSKKNNLWIPADFFATGEAEIAALLEWIDRRHPLSNPCRALDFGCGAGRLSQPLAGRFQQVCGVDLSPRMIALANQYNRHGERCRFFLNDRDDLTLFPDSHFDLIYSNLTLQHMEPRYSLKYIAEFVRVLAPGGLLVFQLPSRLDRQAGWRASLAALLHRFGLSPGRFASGVMEMYGVPRERVVRLIEERGGTILEVLRDDSALPWEGHRYFVAKSRP